MLIKKGNGGQKPDTKNLAVKVAGFSQSSDGVGVVGTRIPDGEKVEVFLTTRGKMAENPRRNSIEKLRDGFKVQRTQYKLEPGGVVVFKGAFKPKGGTAYIASWPNVIAYNEEDAKKYYKMSEYGMMRLFHNAETDTWRGSYDSFAEPHIFTGKSADDLAAGAAGFVEKFPRATFLIRALNERGEVIGFRQISKLFVDDGNGATRLMTPAEVGKTVAEAAAQMNAPGGYSVLPGLHYPVSRKALNGSDEDSKKSMLSAFQAAERAFVKVVKEIDDGLEVQEVQSKRCFVKLSEPNDNGIVYVSGIYSEDPYGPGVDPLTIGGLRVSAELSAVDESAGHHDAAEDGPGADADTGMDPDDADMEAYFSGAAPGAA